MKLLMVMMCKQCLLKLKLTLQDCLCQSWLDEWHQKTQVDGKPHQSLLNPKGHHTQSPTAHGGRSQDDQM